MAKLQITKIEDIDNIISLYHSGMSCIKISKIYNVTGNTISSLLKRNNIDVINKQNLSRYQIKDIIHDYCDLKLSVNKISKKYHTSSKRVVKDLKSNGIDVENFHNKSKFNENIFDSIDTEEKAYWLGFIYADGYIANVENKKNIKYAFELSLCGKDIDHLYKFNSFMQYKGNNVKLGKVKCNGKIYVRCRWKVGNKHLWETLNSYGCTPNKSLNLTFPDIKIFKYKWLIIPFIRGYFDGDGSVSSNSNKSIKISIVGTTNFLNVISNIFFKNKLIKNHDNNDKTYVYNLSLRKARVFLYVIYYNASIYLDRKYQKFYNQDCRLMAKAIKLLQSKIGEDCDVNPELTQFFKANE